MEGIKIPEYIKRLNPKQCLPKMISYMAQKHPNMEHDQIVAMAAADCGVDRKNDYGLDAGIRAALHLAHYKSKYPQLSLRANLGKAYSRIKGINDFVEDFVVDGMEVDLGDFLWEHAQAFDMVNDTSKEGKWVTVRGKHVFIEKGQTLRFSKDGRYTKMSKGEASEKKEKQTYKRAIEKKVEKTGKEAGDVKKTLKPKEIEKAKAERKQEQERRKSRAEVKEVSQAKQEELNKKDKKEEEKSSITKGRLEVAKSREKRLQQAEDRRGKKKPSGRLPSSAKKKKAKPTFKERLRKEIGKAVNRKVGSIRPKRDYTLKLVEDAVNPKKPIIATAAAKAKTPQQLGKQKKKESTKPALEAKRKKAMTQKEAGSKRTKVAQTLKTKYGITPETSVGLESISVPFTVINTESGNIVKGEVTENLKENTIPMTPVSSSNVKGVGQYRNELLVQFRESQGTYRYQFRDPHTAEEAYRSMTTSGSPGRWVWNNLRGHQAGEAITNRKIGPAIFTGRPTIGGTTASLAKYEVSGRTPSGTVQGYEAAAKALHRSTSNPTKNPNTGSKIEKQMKQVKAIRGKLGQGSKLFQHLQTRTSSADLVEDSFDDSTLQYLMSKENKQTKKLSVIQKELDELKNRKKVLNELASEAEDKTLHQKEMYKLDVKIKEVEKKEETLFWEAHETDSQIRELNKRMTLQKQSDKIREGIKNLKAQEPHNETAKSIKEKHIANLEDELRQIRKEHKQGKGRGWHGESDRHSKAAKRGKVGITKDFTMSGLLTRSGAFDYRAEGEGIKYKTPRNLEQVVNNTGHFPVFGKNGSGSHKEDTHTLLGFGHNLSYIPKGQVDNYAHIAGDVEFFYNIHDLSNLADPKNLPVSFSYEDLGSEGIQHMGKIHHLAVSLDASERDRCSTMDGTACNINIKRDLVRPLKTLDFTHDQNLTTEVIHITPNINQEKFTECDLKILREDIQSQIGDGQLFEDEGSLFYFQEEEAKLYELDFDKPNLNKKQKKQKSDTKMSKKDKKKEDPIEDDEDKETEEDLTNDATEIQDGQKVNPEAEGDDDEVEEKIKGDPYNETEKLVKSKDFIDVLKNIVNEAIAPIKDDLAPIIANNLKVEEAELKTIQDLLKEAPYQVSEEAIEGKSLSNLKEKKDFLDSLPYIKNYTETLDHTDVEKHLFDFEPAEVDERSSVLAKAQADFVKNTGGAKEV